MTQHDLPSLASFHPITSRWFIDRFQRPTESQQLAWPHIQNGRNTLIAAPTGSGKTLTAFMVCIDRLLRLGLAQQLDDAVKVVYISPLKALSNDIRRNLEVPLAEIDECGTQCGYEPPKIRALVRTGDTPAAKRQSMIRKPPHILVTTPESLYLLLAGEKSRKILEKVETVIIDEIHALARDKRGSHLSLSLERLDALCHKMPIRIGLSATQKPIGEIARFLVGAKSLDAQGQPNCEIVDIGHRRKLDLEVVVPPSDLSAVCSNEQWEEVFFQLKKLIESHRSTLIFVNTRKMAEKVAFNLGQQLGDDVVTSHHGSLAKERRLVAEERLKNGQLKAIVATASLELGIDIGYIDLVCQIGSPRSIATFLQRIGRAGHSLGAIPKGRLFTLTRDELVEGLGLLRGIRAGRLDRIHIPECPIDILSQQIIAAAINEEWDEDRLYELMCGSYPYRNLTRRQFDDVLSMLAKGYADGRRSYAYIHHDRINRKVRARRGARITAATNAGAIPEQAEYRVVEEDGGFVGTVNEDFAIESMAGDIFLLGNTSWQIVHVRGGDVVVRDAKGAPPTIPFWLGEAPGRTMELSEEVSSIREEVARRIELPEEDCQLRQLESIEAVRHLDPVEYRPARDWLVENVSTNELANLQAVHYIAVQKAALGVVPTKKNVVFERFFDDTGGMQLVIHAPFGSRVNRGWGLALRKRFCRNFDFELQASADDDGIVLSIGPNQSFPLEHMFKMLDRDNIKGLLEQAFLQVPLFQVRWRWNTTRALAVLRNKAGKRIPPALQRFRADDLLTAVFPATTQCVEHVQGDIEIPDHPLVQQTMHDCYYEAVDIDALLDIFAKIETRDIELIPRDTREPSPFSYQLLNASPYAFLDDAPLEERRARAIATRRTLSIDHLNELGRLDPAAIHQVREEAWPLARDEDELHDALTSILLIPSQDERATLWQASFQKLVETKRATIVSIAAEHYWIATESWPLIQAAYPNAKASELISLPKTLNVDSWTREDALKDLVKGQIDHRAVITTCDLARILRAREPLIESLLTALEAEGHVLRGRYSGANEIEWCQRRLLMRIHRLTLDGLRRRIKPASTRLFLRFLTEHQNLSKEHRAETTADLSRILGTLSGFEAPAGAWESEILPARMSRYTTESLDELCYTGAFTWARLSGPSIGSDQRPVRTTKINRAVPVCFFPRSDTHAIISDQYQRKSPEDLAESSLAVFNALTEGGAQFFDDLATMTRMLPTQLEQTLGELARLGLVHADSFGAIRSLVNKPKARSRYDAASTLSRGGRWSLFPGTIAQADRQTHVRKWADILIQRYGIIFRDLLAREGAAPAWWELAREYRLREARGEIRGGRFVDGVAGEQFALSHAVEHIRQLRDQPESKESIVISLADPLNLVGIIIDGKRLSSMQTGTIAIRDGRVIAIHTGDEIQYLASLPRSLKTDLGYTMRLTGSNRRAVLRAP